LGCSSLGLVLDPSWGLEYPSNCARVLAQIHEFMADRTLVALTGARTYGVLALGFRERRGGWAAEAERVSGLPRRPCSIDGVGEPGFPDQSGIGGTIDGVTR
jgi:hypothetical protein